ncbi:MAG: F0F1 ATP synthase subunit B' [Alphaproteobacteria bacterium]|nr:F0F1 ATP synthase subunit B' [Alphaproteobacteria bacterium]
MAAESYGAETGASPGLPQFDFSFFPSQLFWLTVFFTLLYLLLDRTLLPRVGGVIEKRGNVIKADIDAAAQANAEAQQALVAYDSAIAQAKTQARAAMDAARAEAADARAAQSAAVEASLAKKLNAAEERLARQRGQDLQAARTAAEDVAREIVSKLTLAQAA